MIWPSTVETERLLLRRPTIEDAPAIFEGYAQDPDVVRHVMWRPHRSIEDTHDYLVRVLQRLDHGTEQSWAITLKGDDQLIGMIAVRPNGFKHDIGYVLARSRWDRGITTEAARAIVDLSLSDPQVYRVWAVCDVDNKASARVLEKVGMTCEGILRRWVIHPNSSPDPRDALCYALVRNEAAA
jgi:RimJ/RimL family protein N-acetyltransferase